MCKSDRFIRWSKLKVLPLAASLLFVSACASVPDDYSDPRDPWESYNRSMATFNDKLDTYVAKPVAKGYKAVTPDIVDQGITNIFRNIADIPSAVNSLLQFKLEHAVSDVGRVVFNSTFGLLGFFDVATYMGFEDNKEDFGQTLGVWGVPTGPYFVLPFLGPNDVRDTFGLFADTAMSPVTYLEDDSTRIGLTVLDLVDTRSDLMGASSVLEEAALDPYEFLRDAYLQKRLNDVYDGDPPLDDDFLEEEDDLPPE